jgi:hypothetical protein
VIGNRDKGTLRARQLGLSKGINGDVYKRTGVPDPLSGRLVQLSPLCSPSELLPKTTTNMTIEHDISEKLPTTAEESASVNANDPDTTFNSADSVRTEPGSSKGFSSLFSRASGQVPPPPKDQWEVVELAGTAVTPGHAMTMRLTDPYILRSLNDCFQRDGWYERVFLVADIPMNEVSRELQYHMYVTSDVRCSPRLDFLGFRRT